MNDLAINSGNFHTQSTQKHSPIDEGFVLGFEFEFERSISQFIGLNSNIQNYFKKWVKVI